MSDRPVGILDSSYPCCGHGGHLPKAAKAGDRFDRTCKFCQKRYWVTIAEAHARILGTTILRAQWEQHAKYARRPA